MRSKVGVSESRGSGGWRFRGFGVRLGGLGCRDMLILSVIGNVLTSAALWRPQGHLQPGVECNRLVALHHRSSTIIRCIAVIAALLVATVVWLS